MEPIPPKDKSYAFLPKRHHYPRHYVITFHFEQAWDPLTMKSLAGLVFSAVLVERMTTDADASESVQTVARLCVSGGAPPKIGRFSGRFLIPCCPLAVCNIQQRETHGTVGAIQPELYDMDGGNATDSGRDSAELTFITTPCGKLQFTLKYDMDIEGLVVKVRPYTNRPLYIPHAAVARDIRRRRDDRSI